MTIKVEELVNIITERPINVSISGAWGVGKTFLWREVEKKYKEETGDKILYMSLYNVSSIDDLYTKISVNSATHNFKKDGFEKTKDLLSNLSDIFKSDKVKSTLKHVTSGFIDEKVICFDDIERASSEFDAGAFLSFISHLKEDRGCTVILILNEDQIKDLEEFNQHREKCIDYEVYYRPSTKENLDKVFNTEDPEYSIITKVFTELKISNIRLFQRVKLLIDQCKRELGIDNPLSYNFTTRTILEIICLFVYLKYDTEVDNKPTIDLLLENLEEVNNEFIIDLVENWELSDRLIRLIFDYLGGGENPSISYAYWRSYISKPDEFSETEENSEKYTGIERFRDKPSIASYLNCVSNDNSLNEQEVESLFRDYLLNTDYRLSLFKLIDLYNLFEALGCKDIQKDLIVRFIESQRFDSLKKSLVHSRIPHEVKKLIYKELKNQIEDNGKSKCLIDAYQSDKFTEFDFYLLDSLKEEEVSDLLDRIFTISKKEVGHFVDFLSKSSDNLARIQRYIYHHDSYIRELYSQPLNKWRLVTLRRYVFNLKTSFHFE